MKVDTKNNLSNAMHPSTVESVNRWLQMIVNEIQYSRKNKQIAAKYHNVKGK